MKRIFTYIISITLYCSIYAESQEDASLQEYVLPDHVVTSGLWDTELSQSTQSVTIFDQNDNNDSGATHFEDIINSAPNITWTGGTSRPAHIQIRGLGENSQFEGETPDSSVRFLVDDIDYTGLGTVGSLYDVKQVEILRGSQIGSYGINAVGGIVKMVTNGPTSYWSGNIKSSFGQDNLIENGLAVSGPIFKTNPNKFTFRLAINKHNSDGFRKNFTRKVEDSNKRDELNTRLRLKYETDGNWKFESALAYNKIKNGYDEWSANNTKFITQSNTLGVDNIKAYAGSFKSIFSNGNNIKFTSLSSITKSDHLNSYDGDWGNIEDSYGSTNRSRNRWNQELRFDYNTTIKTEGINKWTVGVNFENFDEDTLFESFWGSSDSFNTNYRLKSSTLFGKSNYKLDGKSQISLGVTLEEFNLKAKIENKPNQKISDNLLGGKLTYENKIDDENTLFGTIQKAYKAGGINIYPYLNNVPLTYDSEDLWNYELGLKNSPKNSKFRTKIIIFKTERNHAQVRDSEGKGVNYTYYTTNANKASHYGAEASIFVGLSRNWSVNTSIGLLKTTRRSYIDPFEDKLIAKRDLSNSPSYNFSTNIKYNNNQNYYAQLEIRGSDSYFDSNSHSEKRSQYILLNGSTGFKYQDWDIRLWGRNILNRNYEKMLYYNVFGNEKRYENPANPRQFGISLTRNW
mgnify:FL=1